MAQGNCNCGSITVTLKTPPDSTILCYCANCRRAGGGPCSSNYMLDSNDIEVQDANGTLKSYKDSNTKSGNYITRQFCGNCGSPVQSLMPPPSTMVFLKAALFDHIPTPAYEAFVEDKESWINVTQKTA
ncbi:Mss4-like protein [Clohesyomyces aquaticus]|uniref:Mss4-like protein n=1 Tax=Clohesyomyces aquaticus TaxID=1231657 RepID=A0A1Y2AAK5_9PLEO|nr:Mss4-like protein [Clohesyomyces aquaticus]